MAIDNFVAVLKDQNIEFQPKPFYEPITDSILMYLRNERSYAKRISKHFTLFASNSDDTLVGFEIKGVKDICRAIETDGMRQIVGPIDVLDENGACELSIMLKVATMSPDIELTGCEYEKLDRATKGKRLDLDQLQTC